MQITGMLLLVQRLVEVNMVLKKKSKFTMALFMNKTRWISFKLKSAYILDILIANFT